MSRMPSGFCRFGRSSLRRPRLALAGAALLLAGCAGVRHEPLPAVPVPARWAGAPGTAGAAFTTPEVAVARDFWRAFGDPVLDQLIADALTSNNDLALAAIRVYRAQLQAGLADTNLTPTLEVKGAAGVKRLFSPQAMMRSSGVSATASYELDLWGKLAAQRDAARWESEASDADRETARLGVISTTAQLYWKLGFLNEQIANTQSNIAYGERMVALVRSRYAAGAVSGLDLAQSEQNLSEQRAALTQLVQQRTESRNALAIVFDRAPQQTAAEPSALPTQALPVVPAGLPAALVGRRPDLRAAELRLRKALANVDSTRTGFYPSFTLTGEFGTSSASLERVLQNPIAALGLGLTLPFLQWNTMQLQIRVAQADYEEAVTQFRQRLFTALSEVENALSAREQLSREAEQRARAVAQAQRAQTLLRSRYQAGAVGVQPWLEQLRLLRDAQTAEAQVRLNRLNNRMALYKVLGGAGNASDAEPPA